MCIRDRSRGTRSTRTSRRTGSGSWPSRATPTGSSTQKTWSEPGVHLGERPPDALRAWSSRVEDRGAPQPPLLTRALRTLMATGLVVGLTAPAVALPAEPPQALQDEITDTVGVLGDRTGDVQKALDRLAEQTKFQLFVVYVDSFDDWDAVDWADAAAIDSKMGIDDILLAVAVQDRAYGLSLIHISE